MGKLEKWQIVLIIFAVIIGGMFIAYNYTQNSIGEEAESLEYVDIDLSQIEDGTYEGSYSIGYVRADVRTTVENNKIVNVELVDHYTRFGNKAESITNKIVEEQEINVENEEGAEISSTTIKKAVEDSLIKASEEQENIEENIEENVE